MHGYTPSKDEYLKRLRRIEGQVRGLEKMVEDAPLTAEAVAAALDEAGDYRLVG